MNIKAFLKDTQKIAKISTFIIFLAMIRCICEPFRLQYLTPTSVTFGEIKLFLIAALITSVSLLIMKAVYIN